MKKLYSLISLILFLGFLGINSQAQGTWKAVGTETIIANATAITMGITNLSCMHSDANAAGVVGKTDGGAPTISYNGVTWDNEAFIQGATNAMYYAFLPTMNGVLDIAAKMGSAKALYILELTDACWTFLGSTEDLADLTTTFSIVTNITADASYYTTPTVYDTYTNASATWNGTVFQSTGSNQYTVFSFAVAAHKTYVIAAGGSKFMLRGVNLTFPTLIQDSERQEDLILFPNPAENNVYIKTDKTSKVGIYNSTGLLVKEQLASPSMNNIDVSGLRPGVYYVKTSDSKKAQKLIVK